MDIVIDWSLISSEADFYAQLLSQLRAPGWHGYNLDAIADSIGTGGINGVEPPYRISFVNTARVCPSLLTFSRQVESVLRQAALRRDGIALSGFPARQADGT